MTSGPPTDPDPSSSAFHDPIGVSSSQRPSSVAQGVHYDASSSASPGPPESSRSSKYEVEDNESMRLARDGTVSYGTGGPPQANQVKHKPSWLGSLGRSESTVRRQKQRKDYIAYYLPILGWLPNYDWSLLGGDLIAGATLTALLVPQAAAYAHSLAGVDPIHGLFAAAIPSFIYALLGTCPQLSVGPEASLSLFIGQVASDIVADLPHGTSPHHQQDIAKAVVTMLTFQVGLVTLVLGILRLGFLDSVLSRPLLRGFITSMALVIMVNQLAPLTGLSRLEKHHGPAAPSSLQKLLFVIENIEHTHLLTLAVGMSAVGMLLLYRSFKPLLAKRFPWIRLVPEILFVVIGATALSSHYQWHKRGLDVLGYVSAKHVEVTFPIHRDNWKYFDDTLPSSVVMSALGYIDSVLAGKENSSKYNYHLSPNRELVALGSSNIAASCVSGTIPGFGSLTRSRINAQAGARTPLASLFMGLFMLFTTYFLMPLLYHLPQAILSAIIVLVVLSIISEAPEDIAFFFRLRAWSDLGLMVVTALLTFFGSLELGIVVSIGLSLIMVVHRSSLMQVRIMGREPESREWVEIGPGTDSENEEIPGILIARIRDSMMTFANAGALKERLRRLEKYGAAKVHPSVSPIKGDTEVLILQMAQVDVIDPSALQVLKETIETYHARGVQVYITHLSPEPKTRLEEAGITGIIGEHRIQPTVKAALDHLHV